MHEVYLFLDHSAAASMRTVRFPGKAFGLGIPPAFPFRDDAFEELVRWWDEHVNPWGEVFADDLLRRGAQWFEAARCADRCVVWAGPHLDEQAFAVWALHVLPRSGVDLSAIVLNVVARQTGSANEPEGVTRTALLHGPELLDRLAPRALVAEEVATIERAWTALGASTPDALLDVLARPWPALPGLREGLSYALRRYPDARSGLNSWERALLDAVARVGPRAATIVGHIISSAWEGSDDALATPSWQELTLLQRLLDFADGPAPLVRVDGDPVEERAVDVFLTGEGEDVLAGRACALDLVDYDTWVFGVHIDPRRGRAWVRDGDRVRPR